MTFSHSQFQSRASCLSFDILKDRLGARSGFPVTAYVVAGTQAEQGKKNSLVVMKLSNLHQEKEEGNLVWDANPKMRKFKKGLNNSSLLNNFSDSAFVRRTMSVVVNSAFVVYF